jgi:hypothetical protein
VVKTLGCVHLYGCIVNRAESSGGVWSSSLDADSGHPHHCARPDPPNGKKRTTMDKNGCITDVWSLRCDVLLLPVDKTWAGFLCKTQHAMYKHTSTSQVLNTSSGWSWVAHHHMLYYLSTKWMAATLCFIKTQWKEQQYFLASEKVKCTPGVAASTLAKWVGLWVKKGEAASSILAKVGVVSFPFTHLACRLLYHS